MPSIFQTCNELGSIALGKGDYKEARKQFRQMVKESRKHDGREQAGALNRLGTVCMKEQRYEEAEESFRKSLEISERFYGPSHPEVATELNNLGLVLFEKSGDREVARPLFEKAVQMLEDAMPFSTEFNEFQLKSYAMAFENLACLYEEAGEFDKAEFFFRKLLKIRVDVCGKCSPTVFKTVQLLSNLLGKQGRAAECDELFQEFLPAIEQFSHTVENDELSSLIEIIKSDQVVPSSNNSLF